MFKTKLRKNCVIDDRYWAAEQRILVQRLKIARLRGNKVDREMLSFVAGQRKGEAARERLVTAMFALPYEKLTAQEHNGKTYLVGLTHELEVTDNYGTKHRPGPYYVILGETFFVNQTFDDLHFIPQRRPQAESRFPHHYAVRTDDPNPVAWASHTCTGALHPLLLVQLMNLDIRGLWQTWFNYLTRWDNASMLTTDSEVYQIMRGQG
jgi:hypothetical protein